jgi:SPOR domain
MSMMLTFRAGKLAALMVSVTMLGACSREQQDWRSAEASDTVDGYGEFLHRHPDSELATEARTRVAQLSEDKEWQTVGAADTADAYKQFLAQHPNGKWAQEARIRMENFALGHEGTAAMPSANAAVTAAVASAAVGSGVAPESPAAPRYGSAGGSTVSSAAEAFPAEPARAPASAGSSNALPAPVAQIASSAPVSPGELAQPLASAQVPRGAPAQALPNAASPSPPSTVPSPAGSAQPSPAISAAWRSDDGFGVQLGAFASENAATTEWQQLTARFGAQLRGLAPRVVSANTSTGRLFRLQALVADEAAARALCDMLKKQSQACVPVLPH